ncbi:PepSY domain-containing protein [Microtetraspora niveoalba]|uniref:PepSY domain-containing protein n=1 Tax=Microtetraspora niveoalba TaxID=46175 RepID=UPI000834800C|nr:PepSY domain-containing protein [Microtetraspora niveoalba]
MRKLTIVAGLAAAAAITAGGTAAFAADQAPASSASAAGAPAPKRPAVSNEQAVRAALAEVPGGWVTATELEHEHGRRVWEIEVRASDGSQREVTVDAVKGSVLRNEADHDDDRDDDGHRRHSDDD